MMQPSFNDNCNIQIMMISLRIQFVWIGFTRNDEKKKWRDNRVLTLTVNWVLTVIVILKLWWFHCKLGSPVLRNNRIICETAEF